MHKLQLLIQMLQMLQVSLMKQGAQIIISQIFVATAMILRQTPLRLIVMVELQMEQVMKNWAQLMQREQIQMLAAHLHKIPLHKINLIQEVLVMKVHLQPMLEQLMQEMQEMQETQQLPMHLRDLQQGTHLLMETNSLRLQPKRLCQIRFLSQFRMSLLRRSPYLSYAHLT